MYHKKDEEISEYELLFEYVNVLFWKSTHDKLFQIDIPQ
jgi:hypothetical protein